MVTPRPTALVTGASAGLGVEYARLFARDGHDLVLVARRREKLEELGAELQKAHGVTVTVVPADLADPAAPKAIFERVEGGGIALDALVNNAGFGTNGAFVGIDAAKELEMLEVNIRALVHLTRLFLPGMVKRGRGKVLNIGSTAGFQPGPYMATYYASKAFVLSFTEGLAYELRGTGVTATVSCPGATKTEFAGVAGNDKSLLFKAGAADAPTVAAHGYRAMRAGRVVAIPGLLNKLGAQMLRLSPRAVVRAFAGRLNRA